jgi:hypothetical protein
MATSYANPGGTGLRRYTIIVNTNMAWAKHPAWILDSLNSNTWMPSAAAAGAYTTFDFGTPRVIDEAKWYQDIGTAQGTWKWQGSNDGSTFTDIGISFALGGSTTQTQTSLNGNATPYQYYRLAGVSGSSSTASFIQAIEFKIDAVDATKCDYNNTYGAGDRTATLTITQSITAGSGDIIVGRTGAANPPLSLFVDNLNRVDPAGGANIALEFSPPSVATGVAGRWILFQFPSYQIIDEMRWFQDVPDTSGVWKFQGSNDGSTFTDIGTTDTLGGNYESASPSHSYVTSASSVTMYSQVITGLHGNTSSYLYYRLLGVSGLASGNPFIFEMAFRTKAGAAPSTAAPTLNVIT